jgi:hypothetical protein
MLSLSPATRIFVALEPVDMRNYVGQAVMRSGLLSLDGTGLVRLTSVCDPLRIRYPASRPPQKSEESVGRPETSWS